MQHILDLIKKGEIKPALEALLSHVTGEDKTDVLALLSEYNRHEKDFGKGLEDRNNKVLNRITDTAISICNKHISVSPHTHFPTPPQLDNLPLDAEGYLLGRKAALEDLHRNLQGKAMLTLVNGIGGIGKSTLAMFYAHFPKYKAAYSHCFWVTVSDITGAVEEAIIQAFAEALELYNKPKKTQLQKIAQYLSAFQGKALLILDNANDKAQVNTSLAFLRNCHCKVLFTSRANIGNLPSQALAKLLPEDAFTLFTHYFPAAATIPETPQLLKNIDYHTLLTEFMAKSLAHNPVLLLQDLLAITAAQNFTDELLAYTQFTSYHTHTHSNPDIEIAPAQYLIQIFPIQNLNEQEQEILRYFSVLPTEWIGINMLKQLLVDKTSKKETKPKGFFSTIKNLFSKQKKVIEINAINNELQFGQMLQGLEEKGWLQKSPKNEFACHILLQHILRQQLQPSAENCELLLENLKAATWFDGYTNKLTLAPYLPLVAAVLSWVKEDTKIIANMYERSAAIYEAIGNYQQALNYDIENVRIKEKILSPEDAELATAYNNIGVTYSKLGNHQQSLEYKLKDLAICEKVLSAEHPHLATAYNNIAITYEKLDDYQKSLEYGLKALAIREKVLSAEHPHLATSYSNLDATYEKLGDYQKSLEYGLSALAIRKKILSAEHPDLARSYNNIAITYYYLSNYQKAYTYIQQAVVIWTKVLPEGHPDIRIALNAKAVIEEAMRGG